MSISPCTGGGLSEKAHPHAPSLLPTPASRHPSAQADCLVEVCQRWVLHEIRPQTRHKGCVNLCPTICAIALWYAVLGAFVSVLKMAFWGELLQEATQTAE